MVKVRLNIFEQVISSWLRRFEMCLAKIENWQSLQTLWSL